MSDVSVNNKRIAKNSLLLYVRTFFVMLISLYTSRVVLRTLGVEDYGIYNVVGGIVAMMGILNGAMSVATQRYLTYELGTGDEGRLRKVFSTSLLIYLMLCLILLVLAETVGLWFLNTHLIIPDNRINAANWVFQFSIIASINSLLTNTYNASIIAHEHMNVYAYVSIVDVLLKLIVVYLIPIIPFDCLAIYGLLILICQLIITMIYRVYCMRNFKECKFSIRTDRKLFVQILSFSGWNMFGSIATLLKTQGINIVINMFFSPAVNASRGIAVQINHAVSQFFSNFYTAFRPQITKYYAQNDLNNMFRLVTLSSRYSYYLIFLLSMPILLETPQIINLWLGQMPDYSVIFTRLIILISVVDAMAHPLMTVAQAVGKMKLYQSVLAPIILLNVPLSYLALRYGCPPDTVFLISLSISIICLFLRIFLVNHLVSFPIWNYIKGVYIRCALVTIIACIIPFCCHFFFPKNIFYLFLIIITCTISIMMTIFFMGLDKAEKKMLFHYVVKYKKKILK